MKPYTIKDVIPLLRGSSFSPRDEGLPVVLAVECEEWTHVRINVSSGILDLLAPLVVDCVDVDDDAVRLWIKTSSFNVPATVNGEAVST